MTSSLNNDDFEPDDFEEEVAQADDFEADDFEPDVHHDQPKESRPIGEQVFRGAQQFGIGVAAGTPVGIVYDTAVAPLSSKEAQAVNYRESVLGDIERLVEKKTMGQDWSGKWDEADQQLLDNLTEQIKNPDKLLEHVVTTPDLSIRGLVEGATGQDLTPEGWIEHGLNWAGFLVGGRIGSSGAEPIKTAKELGKALIPTSKEAVRGATTGAALNLAANGQFGPIGTISAAIIGDIAGHGPHAAKEFLANPKKYMAELTKSLTTSKESRKIASQLADDFASTGLDIDAATLTNSPLVQRVQTLLSQSGLVGTPLDNLRKEISNQVIQEYKNTIGELGEIAFENRNQAAEAVMDALKTDEVALNALPRTEAREPRSLEGRVLTREQTNVVPPSLEEAENRLLTNISDQPARSKYAKGEELYNTYREIRDPFKEEFNQRYTNLSEQMAALEDSPQPDLVRFLEDFVAENRGALDIGVQTPQSRLVAIAEELLGQTSTEGDFIGISPQELFNTKKRLSSITPWKSDSSDFKNIYREFVNRLNVALDHALLENPELRQEYLTLSADYEQFKNTFENENFKNLLKRNNRNFESLYKEFENSNDKLRSLEEAIGGNPAGDRVLNQIKRNKTRKALNAREISAEELRDLEQMLGPEHQRDFTNYLAERIEALQPPPPAEPPQAVRGRPLNMQVEAPQTAATKPLEKQRFSKTGEKRASEGQRKKLREELARLKKPEDILNKMDSISGIRRLRDVLNTTPEGKELFKKLARYKLAELVDKKLHNNVTEQAKLGHFAGLLNDSTSQALIKELVGETAFGKLKQLQKNAGKLANASSKFYNASQSGTTAADTALIVNGVISAFTLNPWAITQGIGGPLMMRTVAKLLGDKEFLKYLVEAVKNEAKPKEFIENLKKMQPYVIEALETAKSEEI